jgi:hypothetical protein
VGAPVGASDRASTTHRKPAGGRRATHADARGSLSGPRSSRLLHGSARMPGSAAVPVPAVAACEAPKLGNAVFASSPTTHRSATAAVTLAAPQSTFARYRHAPMRPE